MTAGELPFAVNVGSVPQAGAGSGPPPAEAARSGDGWLEVAARVVLLGLSGMGPVRARWLLEAGPAAEVVASLADGRLPLVARRAPPGVTTKLVESWTAELRKGGPAGPLARVQRELQGRRVHGLIAGEPGWPFTQEPDPPAVLFWQGRLELLELRPRVALVGSRRCSAVGRQVAHRFGRELGERGITVVSGLAAGIDGAAHHGTLAGGGPAVAVVGSGLDRVYPGVNRELWARIGEEGLLLSESPLGTKPEPWRFPARNRLIASLADVVVVIESHQQGGALITVDEAVERGRPVLAVPGAITNPAAAGCNALLADGCTPACSVDDILDAIGWAPPSVEPGLEVAPASGRSREPESALGRAILTEIRAGEVHLDVLIARTGAAVPVLLAEIRHLVAQGWAELDGSTVMLPAQPAWVERPT